jgi:1,4-dihydroxy-2-naphthoate octaprenyltransferase
VEHGLVTVRGQVATIAGTLVLALCCAGYLVYVGGLPVLWLALTGLFFVLFYTWPLKHIGLGEPAVLLVWGPLMIGGTYLAVTGRWSHEAAVLGSIYALGPTTVLFGKHTDKRAADAEKRIRTLPVILGETTSRYSVIAMMVLQPVLVLAAVAQGALRWPMLVVLLGIPAIVTGAKVFSRPRPVERPAEFPEQYWPTYLAAWAFRTNRITGALFSLGLLGDALLVRFGGR